MTEGPVVFPLIVSSVEVTTEGLQRGTPMVVLDTDETVRVLLIVGVLVMRALNGDAPIKVSPLRE